MGFIRTKKIKGNEYAYIVENKRYRRKRVKQKTKKYLGRVYRFDRVNVMDFYEFYDISDVDVYLSRNSKEKIVLDLVKLELFNYGFEEKDGKFIRENCFFDGKRFFRGRGKVASPFNEGFLSDFTLKRVLNFKADTEEDGFIFAKHFVESGLAVPQEVFVGIFRKVFK